MPEPAAEIASQFLVAQSLRPITLPPCYHKPMPQYRIKQIDAFTTEAFKGNPAAVITEAEGLSDMEMQQIANEMNLSETAFILPSDKADFKIGWFTTEKEVLFCGHATIAATHALAEEAKYGMEQDGEYTFNIECLAGILKIKISKQGKSTKTYLEAPKANLKAEAIDLAELSALIEIPQAELCLNIPAHRDHTIDYVFIEVKSLKSLSKIKHNHFGLRDFGNNQAETIKGFVFFTTETHEEDNHVSSRFFSPYYDVIEDPVTGSANAPLALLLHKQGIAQEKVIRAEQGDILGRAGRLEVLVDGNRTTLIGQAINVLDGQINF